MPLALGVVIGRVGDLIIGDHLGEPTSWALAFRYWGGNLSGFTCTPGPDAFGTCVTQLSNGRSEQITHGGATLTDPQFQVIAHGIGVHQTALYDFLSSMCLVLLLLFLLRKPRAVGVLMLTFVTWYAGVRIITDFLRTENRFLGLTGSQWACIGAIVVCAVLLTRIRRRSRSGEDAEPSTDDDSEPPSGPPDGQRSVEISEDAG
jgi:prolipoprotein diacylglyceryltransferase